MIKVGIIIPVYNVEAYIKECFDSVCKQNYAFIECIFVDDKSSDRSYEILQELILKYPGNIDFKLLSNEENRGASAARNKGIIASNSDYLYFMDSDDTITSTCIDELVCHVYLHPEVDLVQGEMLCENQLLIDDLCISKKGFPDFSNDKYWVRSITFNSLPISPCNKLIRSDLLKRNKLYFKEGIVNEDALWIYKLRMHIKSIAFHYPYTYRYRMTPGSVTISSENERKRLKDLFYILDEYIKGIDGEFKELDNFGILKQFYHAKLINVSVENDRYFRKKFAYSIKKVVKDDKVLGLYKLFFLYLKLPGAIFGNTLFFWKKILGLLYRYNKLVEKKQFFSKIHPG